MVVVKLGGLLEVALRPVTEALRQVTNDVVRVVLAEAQPRPGIFTTLPSYVLAATTRPTTDLLVTSLAGAVLWPLGIDRPVLKPTMLTGLIAEAPHRVATIGDQGKALPHLAAIGEAPAPQRSEDARTQAVTGDTAFWVHLAVGLAGLLVMVVTAHIAAAALCIAILQFRLSADLGQRGSAVLEQAPELHLPNSLLEE